MSSIVDGRVYTPIRKLINPALDVWRRDQRCVVCGVRDSTTGDHLPPQGVFVGEAINHPVKYPTCKNCQATNDREFRDIIAFMSVTPSFVDLESSTTQSALDLLNHVHEKMGEESDSPISHMFRSSINRAQKKTVMMPDPITKTEILTPQMVVEIPVKLTDPIILKMVHAYFWIYSKGQLLCDQPGIILWTPIDYRYPGAKKILDQSYSGTNIGEDQFICTHIKVGLKSYSGPSYIGFHFHTDNSWNKGTSFFCSIFLDENFDDHGLTREEAWKAKSERDFSVYETNTTPKESFELLNSK